jgi:hypothetical protein
MKSNKGFETVLPSGYKQYSAINLSDRKTAIKIQYAFVGIAFIIFMIARLFNFPLTSSYSGWLTALITVSLCFSYMFLHELTHGLFIQLISHEKPKYNLSFPYLTTGANVYLTRTSFIIVCLAPVVLWGLILIAALVIIPETWFFIVFIVLIVNFAGSAGDYFQFIKVLKIPKDALLKDDGHLTVVYSKTTPNKA